MERGLKAYAHTHPDTTIVLFEPDRRDPQLFLANTFGYAQRRAMAEHAYQQTRQMLRERHTTLDRQWRRHGLRLDMNQLADPARRLLPPLPGERAPLHPGGEVLRRLERVLDELADLLPGQMPGPAVQPTAPGNIQSNAAVIVT
jgi:NTE family protein